MSDPLTPALSPVPGERGLKPLTPALSSEGERESP
jgi:hypothetical protein